MEQPSASVRLEIEQALRDNSGKLGAAFLLMEQGKLSNSDLVEGGAAANSGAAGNLRATIRALVDGVIPSGPTVAQLAGRSVGGLLRARADFSEEAIKYLTRLRAELDATSADPVALEREDRELERGSRELEQELDRSPGVYVYTLLSFYRTPQKSDPERSWYKVGKTDRAAGVRVGELMRATGLPEDPWIARVYRHAVDSPIDLEGRFHRLLEAAGHGRSESRHAGRDWFATNLEFLDALATTFGCEILERQLPND